MTNPKDEDRQKEREQIKEHLEKMYSIMSRIQKLVEKGCSD
jgi:hypothetical protein